MNYTDIIYLSTNIASLSNVPLRIYIDNKYNYFYHTSIIIKDPVVLYEKEIINNKEKISYIITDDFFYYAFLNYQEYQIVLGPFRLKNADSATLSTLAFSLEINKDDIPDFISSMKTINRISLEMILQELCILYFVLSNEKITIKDILVDDEKIKTIDETISKEIKETEIDDINPSYVNNSLTIERDLYKIVENGEIGKLKEWIKKAPAVRPGALSKDNLRHTKNTFIVAATLTSRAAIKGNMDPMQALALSDLYIQKMELLQNSTDIYSLQMNMILDYTRKISKIKSQSNSSQLLISLNKYILNHLSDAIKSDDLCDALYISKSALFKKIKEETKMTVSNYILNVKINEAKELLKYTDRSIGSISIYLGFSSQSHFNHAFKKFTTTTPIDYRKKMLS